LFLILHLKHFWVVSRLTDEIVSGNETLYGEMQEVFANVWVVLIYVLGCISLSYHLLHGFQSAFQSLGINHPAWNPIIQGAGNAFSFVVPLIFAAMPVSMYMGWIN
jgi:succinate dehydrogenase / fumarate reductase cytochrome b subunit